VADAESVTQTGVSCEERAECPSADLGRGSGIEFTALGTQSLKGFAEEWELFAVRTGQRT
jgi:hypothetical protein